MRVWLPVLIALSLLGFAIAPVGSSAAVLRGSIEYSKSGGIAGIEESMKIDRDGRGKIARSDVPALRAARAAAWPPRSAAPTSRTCAARRAPAAATSSQYEIRYRGHTVTWDDGNEDQVPRRVRELQAMLGEFYERYSG